MVRDRRITKATVADRQEDRQPNKQTYTHLWRKRTRHAKRYPGQQKTEMHGLYKTRYVETQG